MDPYDNAEEQWGMRGAAAMHDMIADTIVVDV